MSIVYVCRGCSDLCEMEYKDATPEEIKDELARTICSERIGTIWEERK
jgi:hypothetical protein